MGRFTMAAALWALASCGPGETSPGDTDTGSTDGSVVDPDTNPNTDTGLPTPGERPEPRIANLARGSCDGIVDYADELRPSHVQVVRRTDVGDGVVQVELSVRLVNHDRARFRSASVTLPVEDDDPLGILADVAQLPADFGAIEPHGSKWSLSPLQLQLPAVHVPDLVAQIEAGTRHVIVYADEEPVYPPGTSIRTWSELLDQISRDHAGNPLLPQEPATDVPGTPYWLEFDVQNLSRWIPGAGDVPTYTGDASGGYPTFDWNEAFPGTVSPPPDECLVIADDAAVFLTPGDDVLWSVPPWLHYVRVRTICPDVELVTGARGFGLWVERTTHDRLPDVVDSGSFCTGPAHHVGQPVAASRVSELDGQVVPSESRDGHGQPIRFNVLPWWADGRLSVSGQIGCNVLKPHVAFRIRDDRVHSGFGFDSACSITTELRAYDDVDLDPLPDPIELWSHCFSLPSIPLGTANIPMTLKLEHLLDVNASASAGAVVGFTKRWDSGFSVSCDAMAGERATCTSESHRNPTPIEFTPPQLTDDTNLSLEATTTLEASLRLGFAYPLCDLGAGVTMGTTASAAATLTPTLDPWWRTTYGLQVAGGVDFGLFALGLVDVQTDLFAVEDGVDAGGPLLGGSARISASAVTDPPALVSGADQRWSVAIDDTTVPNGVDVTAIAALPDGSALVTASEPLGRSVVVQLDRFGALQWARRLSSALRLVGRRVRTLSDGTAIVGAGPTYLARFDDSGDVLWSFAGDVARPEATFAKCQLRDVVPLEPASGVYDYVVVGVMGAATNQGSYDGCALRVNADGSVPWAKIYGEDGAQQFFGATATRDGGIGVVGEAYGELSGNRRFPLFAKLDARTGALQWWRALPMLRGARLNSVAEAPDGRLFGAGAASRTIGQTGAALVAFIGADGSDAHHAMLFQDFQWESTYDFEDVPVLSAGETAYDEFFDIAPMGNGFVLAGRTGLGVDTEAWVVRIDRQLGVEWYRTLDGASTDSLGGIAPTSDGVLVSGYSVSLPEPDGPNSGESQLWVTKLPYTGAVELRPEADVVTRYIASGVRDSSHDPAVTGGASAVATPKTLTVTDAALLAAGPDATAVTATTTYCAIRLTESGHDSTLDACAE